MAKSTLPSNQTSHLPSHILYQNSSRTITLIDIPRSIEDAQSLSSEQHTTRPKTAKRLISCKPIDTPYPSLEPKSAKALRNAPEKRIEELMLERYVQLALDEMMGDERWEGKVCLKRIWGEDEEPKKKRKSAPEEAEMSQQSVIKVENVAKLPKRVEIDGISGTMPPKSTMIYGNIPETVLSFNTEIHEDFPKFHVIIADPPWPNRSALRKDAYVTASGFGGIESLLRSLPCHQVERNGYVGIWITNKPTYRSMLLDEGGLFDHWGLELVEEWIWLKVTSSGEPMCEISGTWRKPWEILLVGRKKSERESVEGGDSGFKKSVRNEELNIEKGDDLEGSNQHSPSPSQTSSQFENSNLTIKRRIIIGVPDLHSRKPNLRFLFRQLLGLQGYDEDFRGLEIFARNLTAGWWGWGNEVLKFQDDGAWVVEEGCDDFNDGKIADEVLKAKDEQDREDEKSDGE
ncbi:putative mt-a70 family protein [Botrytis fragariae]|uniref:Putative mt-a70 family protein n=1 Tax=Botrytis fragariae TaxID=1964551 RepID=A0A8H6ASR3_9HELO|nr:putative mt-a70 family protein [Botrytis fragariae]KAF5872809.1 putative mt-a70 family protein [Botrytis fragariae]